MKIQSTPLGDRHHGRETCLIQTETGAYIRKPRSSKTEEAFQEFCEKLGELGLDLFSRVPHILQKGEKEHTQCVEENIPTDENGVHRYYKRAGVLLFFAYLLGSNDLHCENLIASGDMPVLIDLETLLTGKARGGSGRYNLSQSVMRSHLLCNFMGSPTGAADVSGFSGVTADLKNIPHTSTGRVFLWEHREVFTEGFQMAYGFALAHQQELSQLLHLFDRCTFRQILRPTKTYAAIGTVLSKLSENQREYATALLSKAYERDLDKNRLEKAQLVLQNEVDAVVKGEIPLFYTYGNGTDLYCQEEKVLEDHLVLSPVEYAQSRLEALSHPDLERQLQVIRLAIDASTPLQQGKPSFPIPTGQLCPGEMAGEMVTGCAVEGLSSVFCGLQSSKNGSVDFVSYHFSLYQGLCGILCMYAALYRKTGKAAYKTSLYRYYENVRRAFFQENEKILLNNSNCSLADGILGVIASMEHLGRLTEDAAFIHDAKTLAQRLVLPRSPVDTDYLNGIGALPLVRKKLGMDADPSMVSLFEEAKPFTTGVAHGSSGIALSLCACNAMNFSKNIEKSVLDVLQWENGHYSENDHNWYDLRDSSKKGFLGGWCSGAPGIGMARKYIQENTQNQQLKQLCQEDLDKVRMFLEQRQGCKRDTLCCGTAAVLMGASVLGVPVDRLYEQLCQREKNQELKVSHIANTWDNNVSLMQGLAGIAYALAMYGDPLCGGMLI